MMTGLKFAAFGALLALAAATGASADSIIGGGRGVDHMGIAVRDLGAATRDFSALGFRVSQGGRFPGGLSNAIIHLDDRFYIELLAAAPQHSKDNNDIADFAKKHEGAMFLGIDVSSAKDTVAFLRARNFDVVGPQAGSIMSGNQTKPPPPMWYTAYTPDKPAKGKRVFTLPIFFIQYTPTKEYEKRMSAPRPPMPNTATAVRGVWFLVNDQKAKLHELRDGGFESRVRDVWFLGPAKSVGAGRGTINLQEPMKSMEPPSPPVEERIFGISIAVKDLGKARAVVAAAIKRDPSVGNHFKSILIPPEAAGGAWIDNALSVYKGSYGKSILIPPEAAHGVWIELVQQ